MSAWPPSPEAIERPAYRSLARIISRAIETGELAPGDRLPTHRDLAWRLGLSVQTVSRAYETLIRSDILSGQVGRGTFVRGTGGDRAPPYARLDADAHVIDCSMLTPVVGGPQARLMSEALAALAQDLPHDALTSYRPRRAVAGYIDAMVGWLRLCGVAAPPDRVIPTNGATAAMTVALMTAAPPGSLVVTETLGHHTLTTLPRHLGLHLAGLPVDAEGILPAALDRACREGPVRALYAMTAGLSARACTMGAERRLAICEIARRHDVLIIENDAWGPIEPGRPPPLAALAPERVFYFTGFSKCTVPGLRLGALVAPGPFVEAAATRHLATNWMAPAIIAEIGARWIRDGTAEVLLDWQRRALGRRNRIATQALAGLDWAGGPRGLHVWVGLPDSIDEGRFVADALARGVALASGSAFAIDVAEPYPRGVRICLGGPSERELAQALAIVRDLACGADPAEPASI